MIKHKTQTGKSDDAKRKMLELLESGEYQFGERLPSESELVKILGCCRGTVREVIALLVSEGYLSHIHGSGTYVEPGRQKYYTIAAIFPDLCKEPNDTGSIAPIISAIVAEARQHNAEVIFYGCGYEDKSIERSNIRRAIDRKVDAAIIWYVGEELNVDALDELHEAGIPFVFVDRYVEKFNPDYAVTDSFTGTFDAVNAIAQLGVQNIYYVTSLEKCTSIKERMYGYTIAVNTLGLSCNVVYSHINSIVRGVYSEACFNRQCNEYTCLKKTIESIKYPAAIFSANMIVNMVVHEVLRDLDIPNDQIVLGHFDPDPPVIATDKCYFEVDQPFTEMGEKAVQIAMGKINGKTELQQVTLKPKLAIHNLSSFTSIKPEVDALMAVACN